MRIITPTVRIALRFSSSRQYGTSTSHALKGDRPPGGAVKTTRATATGAFRSLEKLVISDPESALEVATRLTRSEQALLRDALEDLAVRRDVYSHTISDMHMKKLFIVNALPFIAFGFLDNMIMIIAGNYIDQKLGALLCLSTMAAAGLGNLISDVAGVGLAHYVESIFIKLGIRHPVLTAEQLASAKARWTTNSARAFGLSIGCIIGMFPLLFFGSEGEEKIVNKPKASNDS